MSKANKKLILNWLNYNRILYDTHIDSVGAGIMVRTKDVERVYNYISKNNKKAEIHKKMDNLYVVYYNLKKVI